MTDQPTARHTADLYALAAGTTELAADLDRCEEAQGANQRRLAEIEAAVLRLTAERHAPPDLDRLLHLADRARRGVALDAEHDALAMGITEQAAALDRVRRLCDLTIHASVRVAAVEQARDTLTAITPPKEN